MKRYLVAAIAALGLSVAAPARAQTTTTTWTFTTVDSVQASYNASLTIRGVLSGDAGPTDKIVNFSSSTSPQIELCQRLALLAMEKPGFYVLTVSWTTIGYPTCKLARAVP